MADVVSCTFFNPKTKLIERQDVSIDTGLQAKMIAVRDACQARCRQHDYRWFCIPSFVERGGTEKWFVFQYIAATQIAILKRDWPTRDSAEMWVQHNGA